MCQAKPKPRPKITKAVFQIVVPSRVNGTKTLSFILVIPQGIEIRLRTMGIKRQINTLFLPCFLSFASAFSICSFLMCRSLPKRLSQNFVSFSFVISVPTKYKTSAPRSDPADAAAITRNKFKSVTVVKKPENDKMISEGMGGNMFSSAISENTPK